jgi:hypothetical protein
MARPSQGGEKRTAVEASRHKDLVSEGGVSLPVCNHLVAPERGVVPARCNSSGAAVNVCSAAPAWAQRAERAADGGVVDVSRALSVSSCAP